MMLPNVHLLSIRMSISLNKVAWKESTAVTTLKVPKETLKIMHKQTIYQYTENDSNNLAGRIGQVSIVVNTALKPRLPSNIHHSA